MGRQVFKGASLSVFKLNYLPIPITFDNQPFVNLKEKPLSGHFLNLNKQSVKLVMTKQLTNVKMGLLTVN